jgi:hypothetical protein
MHSFTDLVQNSTAFTLNTLGQVEADLTKHLESSGATSLVRSLQMVALQKTLLAVGMFSMFEAILQSKLSCDNGFVKAKEILSGAGETDLLERFQIFYLAINVLKHGRGKSYDVLNAKTESLPFRMKRPDETFFDEGDVAEVETLIQVDDAFLMHCANLVGDISEVINRTLRAS